MGTRDQSGVTSLPYVGPRENEIVSARDRGQMRVQIRFAQLGISSCDVSQVRQIRLRAYIGEISSKFFVLSKVLRLK